VYLANPPVLAGVLKDSPAAQAGLAPGDRLAQVNGKAVSTWREVLDAAEKSGSHGDLNLVYARGEQNLTATVKPGAKPGRISELVGFPAAAVRIEDLVPGMPADRAGVKPGDVVRAVNGQPMVSVDQFYETVQQSGGQTLTLDMRRNGAAMSIAVRPYQDTQPDGKKAWKIGAYPGPAEVHYRGLPVTEAASLAVTDCWAFSVKLVGGIWQLLTAHASLGELSGPVGIARISGQAARRGVPDFLSVLAIISLNLAIVNFLPIPILDGGHLLMLALEGVRRRDFSAASRERYLRVGMAFLLLLFVLVMYNDLRKLIPAKWLG